MHPIPCFRAPLTPGVGVQGRNYFKNLSAVKIYNCAKFHPDWSDGLDFYKVRTYIYIYIFCALYIRLAGSTRRCPGHYIKIIKCIVRAKVARKVSPKVLHLLFNKLCLKMTDHGSRSTWGPGPSRSGLRAQKYDLLPLKQTFPTTFVL
jgi:hypothetical protein